MRLVVALGGNALLRREQALTAENQLVNIRRAAEDRANEELKLKLRKLELLESKLREAQASGEPVDPARLADEIDILLGRKTAKKESA
jgi:hypothetical protein